MIDRRDFLSIAGASGVLAAMTAPLSAENTAAENTAAQHSSAANASADARASSSDHAAPDAPDFDFTWIDKLTGKYRAVFDSVDVAEGAAFFRANMWRNQYKQVYNTDASDTNAVVVVRHHGFALAMNNAYWDKYEVPKTFHINDEDGNPLKKNSADGNGPNSIQGFVASGGIVLGCNVAFGQVISDVRKKENISRDEADKLARTYLIPGVILQPSGIFAGLRAQEAGCKYIIGS